MYFRKITSFFLAEQIAIFQLFSLFEVTEGQFCRTTLSEAETKQFVVGVSLPAWEWLYLDKETTWWVADLWLDGHNIELHLQWEKLMNEFHYLIMLSNIGLRFKVQWKLISKSISQEPSWKEMSKAALSGRRHCILHFSDRHFTENRF